jgi:macrolide-specific efflux system membrane fusion protein
MGKLWTNPKTRAVCIGIAASVLFVASGCSIIPKEEEPLAPPLVKPVRENFEVAEVKTGTIVKKLSNVAVVESSRTKNHEFVNVSGKVLEVYVSVGQQVKKGDPLIVLDPGDSAIVLKERERDYEVAKYNLEEAKKTQDPQKMKIRLMELEIAQMKLDEAIRAAEGKTLKAEMDGLVTFVENVNPGDNVQPNRTYVIVSDPKSVRLVYTATSSADIQEVEIGMKAEINFKGQRLEGTVVQTPANTPTTDDKALADKYAKTVVIGLPDMPQEMTIGTTVEFSIITRKKDNALIIPARALSKYLGRTFVKVQEGDSIKEVDVETGIETPGEIEIVRGLKEGQRVVLP